MEIRSADTKQIVVIDGWVAHITLRVRTVINVLSEKVITSQTIRTSLLLTSPIRRAVRLTRYALMLANIELDRRAKDVGKRFIERPDFTGINERMLGINT